MTPATFNPLFIEQMYGLHSDNTFLANTFNPLFIELILIVSSISGICGYLSILFSLSCDDFGNIQALPYATFNPLFIEHILIRR
ncbi:MAG: hypothetical protein DRO09_01740 [Thermoprotei archaeon]|nr:MAG: hypothetical protein DRO09_01740 [Thermoprotei archaeon]